MKIYILKPCFSLKHFKSNIFVRRSSGRLDLMCLIHALTFNVIFFKRKGIKHLKANKIHIGSKVGCIEDVKCKYYEVHQHHKQVSFITHHCDKYNKEIEFPTDGLRVFIDYLPPLDECEGKEYF